jgi:hypothetical protein
VGGDPWGALLELWGGEMRVVCMRDIFILNEISVQDKIYHLVGTSLGLKIVLTTLLAQSYKQHIL